MAGRHGGIRWLSARLIAVAGLVAVAGELSAQPQGPIKLFPDVQDEQGVSPEATPGEQPGAPEPEAADPGTDDPAADPTTVRVEGLDAPSIDAIGLVDGLEPELWQGSNIDRVTRLIEELPLPADNPPLIEFTRRMLVTGVRAGESLSPGAMLARRVEQLIRLGALEDAAALLEQIPDTDVDEPVTRRAAEVALWRGQDDAACALGEAVDASAGGTFWGKLSVFCRQSAGADDEAELALALLRDSVDHADRRFVALAEGRDDAVMTGEPWTALQTAMLARRGGTLPGPALAEPPGPLIAAIARQPELAPGEALEIAERAFILGAIDRDRLIELYRSDLAAAGEPAPTEEAEAEPGAGPAARAATFQALEAAEEPAVIARSFDELFAAVPPEERVLTGLLFAPQLNALTPSEEVLFAAPAVARALIGAGYPRPAAGWLRLLRAAAADDVWAREALAALGPLFAVAGEAGAAPALDLAMLESWRTAVDPEPLLEARLLAVAEGAKDELPLKVWWAADRRTGDDQPPDLGRPVYWRILDRAHDQQATGEALLAGLHLLEGDPAGAHPEAVIAGLGAIRGAGYAEEAKAIAAATLIRLGL
ncbi:MAG: hypothetical protein R3349_00140 [Geminicoccaceae bacterium]|nr:hypothetical protein [Geminicoccaceae bacterium]